ncbi:hypothetical protein DFH28DRAFT_1084220 [Melampsora americana]|nr:hypothetical protein DFH28DRAFT_1084220 [Melampsora americana]
MKTQSNSNSRPELMKSLSANSNGKRDRTTFITHSKAIHLNSSSSHSTSHHSPNSFSFSFRTNPQPFITSTSASSSHDQHQQHQQHQQQQQPSLMMINSSDSNSSKNPTIKPKQINHLKPNPNESPHSIHQKKTGFSSEIKNTLETDFDFERENENQERQSKRRKGVAGTILDSAIEMALFTSAMGYAAFQLWKGNPISESPSQSRLPLRPVLPSSPPPPYEPSSNLLTPHHPSTVSQNFPARPRLNSNRSSQRKVTHIHVSRPRNLKPYHSTTSIVNPTFSEPIQTISEGIHQKLKLNQEGSEEEEEDLMGDFIPSINHYIPPTPTLIEEPLDQAIREDLEVLAFKDKIQELIKSGHDALASKPMISNEIDCIPSSEPNPFENSHQSNHHHHHHHHQNRLPNQSNEIILLENALDQTLKRNTKSWWET